MNLYELDLKKYLSIFFETKQKSLFIYVAVITSFISFFLMNESIKS